MAYIHSQTEDLTYAMLEDEVLAPIRGKDLSGIELFVAILLLRATSEVPIKQAAIINAAFDHMGTTLTDRKVREIVRSLRRDRTFPICSRKGAPAGYWWGRTESELEEFIQVWKAQFLDEAQTLSIMIKANFPRLAGQLRLGLEE
jgi:hypothetical protein